MLDAAKHLPPEKPAGRESIACPHCKGLMHLTSVSAGRRVRCPHCRSESVAPTGPVAEEPCPVCDPPPAVKHSPSCRVGYCPTCRRSVADDAYWCPACGSPNRPLTRYWAPVMAWLIGIGLTIGAIVGLVHACTPPGYYR